MLNFCYLYSTFCYAVSLNGRGQKLLDNEIKVLFYSDKCNRDLRLQTTVDNSNFEQSFHSPLNWQPYEWHTEVLLKLYLTCWKERMRVNKKEESYFPASCFEYNLCFFGSLWQSFYCPYLTNLIKRLCQIPC